MVLAQKLAVLFGFHAFGDHLERQVVRQCNHRQYNSGIFRIGEHVAHERLINFQGIYAKSFQIAEAGIAGTEIVYGQLHASGPELAKSGDDLLHILSDQTLGQFQFELSGR